jgi:predicted DsbA family dithiol-disulfide isomerase
MRIDIWSDVACPWCYVGKRNLETAIDELGIEVEIRWRAYELDPEAPPSTSLSMAEVLSRKYGVSVDEAHAMNANMTRTAERAGLEYHLDDLKLGNSFDAHRLAKLAEAHDLGDAAAEALFAAYFTMGRSIADHATLLDIGVAIGLDQAEVAEMLASDAYADEVRGDEAMAAEAGFSGVPTFVVDGAFAIPGAQPADTFVRLLGKMASGDTSDFVASPED